MVFTFHTKSTKTENKKHSVYTFAYILYSCIHVHLHTDKHVETTINIYNKQTPKCQKQANPQQRPHPTFKITSHAHRPHPLTERFSGCAELRRSAVAAASARAASNRLEPSPSVGVRAASIRTALANSLRLVELGGGEGERERRGGEGERGRRGGEGEKRRKEEEGKDREKEGRGLKHSYRVLNTHTGSKTLIQGLKHTIPRPPLL